MLRLLVVFAVTLSAFADAQARTLRLSFRPRATSFVSGPAAQPAVRKTPLLAPTLVVLRRDRTGPASPSFAPDVPSQPSEGATSAKTPSLPPIRVAVQPATDRAAHWCDNGAIIGSGKGFCVVNVGSDDPT